MIIDQVFSEFELWRSGLPQGAIAGLRESDRPAAAGRAARLDVETAARLVQVMIWESGEVDLLIGDLSSGEVLVNEHREISTQHGIRELLADVLGAITE